MLGGSHVLEGSITEVVPGVHLVGLPLELLWWHTTTHTTTRTTAGRRETTVAAGRGMRGANVSTAVVL